MAYQGVTLRNTVPANDLTFVLEDSITKEHVGLAVTQDTSAANKVKLAGAEDVILGRLESFEDRSAVEGVKVGTVKIIGGMAFKKTSAAINLGDKIAGGENGLVKKATAQEKSDLAVWEVNGDYVTVVKTH